jgi:hypothetical protein
MFGLNLNIWCIGAAVLGLFLGYMFAYSARQQQPSGNEIAALFATVLGGSALTLINQFQQCADALPLYVIGVAIGYVLYVFVLKRNWALVQHLQEHHSLEKPPLAPWLAKDPCCSPAVHAITWSSCSCAKDNTEAKEKS